MISCSSPPSDVGDARDGALAVWPFVERAGEAVDHREHAVGVVGELKDVFADDDLGEAGVAVEVREGDGRVRCRWPTGRWAVIGTPLLSRMVKPEFSLGTTISGTPS
jgi:hypothetical protein